MKTHQTPADELIYELGLEAQVMEDFHARATEDYQNTHTIMGKHWYALGLESNEEDQQKDQGHKSSILVRVIDALIAFIKRILQMILKFLSGVDMNAEDDRRKQADDIRKNKQSVDFVKDTVAKLSAESLAVIAAIETDTHFTPTFNQAIKYDRDIELPRNADDIATLNKNRALCLKLTGALNDLNSSVEKYAAMEENERNYPLEKALKAGLSINGSENGEYLKTFAASRDLQQKYEHMLKLVERFRNTNVSQSIIDDMQKVVSITSKQFVMEVKVFIAYTDLNKAIIHVNNKIFAKG